MIKWEYKLLEVSWEYGEPTLDEWGAQGWELISCAMEHGRVYCVLKRPTE